MNFITQSRTTCNPDAADLRRRLGARGPVVDRRKSQLSSSVANRPSIVSCRRPKRARVIVIPKTNRCRRGGHLRCSLWREIKIHADLEIPPPVEVCSQRGLVLTASTALGTPIGTVIGGLGDWRWTMVFVSALAGASGLGVWALLSHIPLPPAISLAERVAPIRDPRVALTLLTGLVYQAGHFVCYTYFTVVFDRVLQHNTMLIGALLVLWGTSGMVANLITGRLSDLIGNRKVIVALLIVLALVMAWLPWASANIWTTAIAVAIWGAAAWGLLAPQQHRLVALAPRSASAVPGSQTPRAAVTQASPPPE